MDLKQHARSLGLRQQDLADKFGVSVPTISNWLNRVYPPPTHHLRAVAEALQVPLEELLPAQEEAGE